MDKYRNPLGYAKVRGLVYTKDDAQLCLSCHTFKDPASFLGRIDSKWVECRACWARDFHIHQGG